MRIDATAKCKAYPTCETYSPISVEVSKSLNVDKTNTLHQFDTAGIVGVPSPVGKVPIVFYMKESAYSGRRGIIYYDDYDSINFMYPESEHAGWMSQPYAIKYDKLEEWDNGEEKGWHRNWGILDLWASVWRRWYNGQVMYRPRLKIQSCGHDFDGYPGKSSPVVVEEKKPSRKIITKPIKKKVNHSCNCRKGA